MYIFYIIPHITQNERKNLWDCGKIIKSKILEISQEENFRSFSEVEFSISLKRKTEYFWVYVVTKKREIKIIT